MKAAIPNLKVKVISPFDVLYEGEAQAVSAVSAVGAFDILPNHANFMTLLIECEVQILTHVDERKFPISHGILKVDRNSVVVFANI